VRQPQPLSSDAFASPAALPPAPATSVPAPPSLGPVETPPVPAFEPPAPGALPPWFADPAAFVAPPAPRRPPAPPLGDGALPASAPSGAAQPVGSFVSSVPSGRTP